MSASEPSADAPTDGQPVGASAQPPLLLWGAMLAIGLAWGASGPLSKIAVSTGNHPVGVAFWTSVIGAILLTTALLARGGRLPLNAASLRFFLICGFLGTALPNSLSYEGFRHLPVGIVLMVVALTPMATLAMAWLLGLERPTRTRVLGVGLGLVAMAMLLLPDSSLPEPGQSFWTLLMGIVALSYAAENVYIARSKPEGFDALTVMAGLFCGAVVLLGPTMLALDAFFPLWPLGAAEQALIGAALFHIGAYFGFVWLIGRGGPVFASQVGYVVTGSGVLLGILIFGETHGPWVWAALCVLFLGLALVKPQR